VRYVELVDAEPDSTTAVSKYSEFTPVRTAAFPMAFSRREFWRGVRASWLTAMLLLIIGLTIAAILDSGLPWGPPLSMIFIYLMYGVPIGGLVSGVVAVALSPAAWLLGRALSREGRVPVHLVAYASLGAVVGLLTLVTYLAIVGANVGYAFTTPAPLVLAGGSAIAVVTGWIWTVRKSQAEQEPRLH